MSDANISAGSVSAGEPDLTILKESLYDYAVIQMTPDGRITDWSAGAERTFGYTKAEVMGRSFELIFTEEDRAAGKPSEELSTSARKGTAEDERWHVRKDGVRLWVSGTVRSLHTEDGSLSGYTKIARDITPQKLAAMQRDEMLRREQEARQEAERRWAVLEEVSENIPAFVAAVRLPEQVYMFANRMYRESAAGRPLIGRSFRETHPGISPELIETFERVAATGEPYRATGLLVNERYFDLLYQPILSSGRENGAILIFAVEVTARMQVIENAREQSELLDLAQDAIIALRLDGTVELWNRGAEETYGWKKEEAIGQDAHQLLHTEFPQPRAEIVDALLTKGQWIGELKHRSRGGQALEVSSRWVLRKRHGKPYGWLEINRDITERMRMDAHLREAQKLESLGVLAGGIAHDFNNLLTGIMGNISLALEMEPLSGTRDLLFQSLSASEQAAFLTRQMLAYAGKGQFFIERANLASVVRDALALVGGSIPKDVHVKLAFSDDMPEIQADLTQLKQVAMNLILNAAEAIGDQAGEIVVRAGSRKLEADAAGQTFDVGHPAPGRYAVLEVEDTGSGIEESVRPKLFDPFFSTKFAGRGLGLAAISGIARAMNGAIQVESTPGRGATFRVYFPAGAEAGKETPTERRLPVLVVDDEETVRRTVEAMLRKSGYEVLLACNGKEALDLVGTPGGRVELIILDLTMPVMGGAEAIGKLKALRPDVPVIVSSGYSEQEAMRRFGSLGVAGFIQKPYTFKGLMEKIASVRKG